MTILFFTQSKTNRAPWCLWHLGALVGLSAMFFMGCSTGVGSPASEAVQPAGNSQAYHATGANEWIEATLFGEIANSETYLAIQLKNPSQEPITLDFSELGLFPEGGIKSACLGGRKVILASGETHFDTLEIQPIHQARMYQEYGWTGLPARRYSMPLAFIDSPTLPLSHQSLDLHLVEDNLSAPEVQLYQLAPSGAWMEEQVSHWQGLLWDLHGKLTAEVQEEDLRLPFDPQVPPFVHVSLPELSCGGVNVRMASHQRGDSLYVNLRMVNHSHFTVSVPLSHLTYEGGKRTLVPAQVQLPVGMVTTETGEYWLKKGQRMEATLIYAAPEPIKAFVLRLDQIRVQEVNAKAFHAGVTFVRDVATSHQLALQ
ncbi:MAG: hypothetical protein AAFQ98_21720 [Bacteroidota bacterium]